MGQAGDRPELLSPPPVALPKNWVRLVNEPHSEAEVAAVRESIARGRPFGPSPSPSPFPPPNDGQFRQTAAVGYDRLEQLLAASPTDRDIESFTDWVRDMIAPWNTAGLMNPASQNMYRHTVARK